MNSLFQKTTAPFLCVTSFISGYAQQTATPNVILIMADDMGYECLGSNGSTNYSTPRLDRLAAEGVRFTHCISQPLSTPSRVKIMTGQYNFRNYESFQYLNEAQYTIGSLMKNAGYKTCIAGKWQLNGVKYQKAGYDNPARPNQFGFDRFCLWQVNRLGSRYADPLIDVDGKHITYTDEYGPDIFCRYILNFIRSNKQSPFFVYYPMVLVHDPFVPTPDSEEWENPETRKAKNNKYFADMMNYCDKIVGRIHDELEKWDLLENTLILFVADNGTHRNIISETVHGRVKGGKGTTSDAGTRVPFVAYWKDHTEGVVYESLIELSDFMATLADMTRQPVDTDGESFWNLLQGKKQKERETVFVHYDPNWGFGSQYRNRFCRTIDYKLYWDGRFYHVSRDPLEENDISQTTNKKEIKIKNRLQRELDNKPPVKWLTNAP